MCFKIMRNLVDIKMEDLFGKQSETINDAQTYHQQKSQSEKLQNKILVVIFSQSVLSSFGMRYDQM
jgi:hypothetical protein